MVFEDYEVMTLEPTSEELSTLHSQYEKYRGRKGSGSIQKFFYSSGYSPIDLQEIGDRKEKWEVENDRKWKISQSLNVPTHILLTRTIPIVAPSSHMRAGPVLIKPVAIISKTVFIETLSRNKKKDFIVKFY